MCLQILIGSCLLVIWSPHSKMFPQLVFEISLRGPPFRTQISPKLKTSLGTGINSTFPSIIIDWWSGSIHLLPVWQASSGEQALMEKSKRDNKNYYLCSPLQKGLANFFCRGQDSKYFTLCESKGLCHSYSTLPLYRSNHGQYVSEWVWLRSNGTLFIIWFSYNFLGS